MDGRKEQPISKTTRRCCRLWATRLIELPSRRLIPPPGIGGRIESRQARSLLMTLSVPPSNPRPVPPSRIPHRSGSDAARHLAGPTSGRAADHIPRNRASFADQYSLGMVDHTSEQIEKHMKGLHPLAKAVQKTPIVCIILEKTCPIRVPIPNHPTAHMIDRTRKLHTQMPCHSPVRNPHTQSCKALFINSRAPSAFCCYPFIYKSLHRIRSVTEIFLRTNRGFVSMG